MSTVVGRKEWDVPPIEGIDATFTRKGTWWVTYPCGDHVELMAYVEASEVRVIAVNHRNRCRHCRGAHISIDGERERK